MKVYCLLLGVNETNKWRLDRAGLSSKAFYDWSYTASICSMNWLLGQDQTLIKRLTVFYLELTYNLNCITLAVFLYNSISIHVYTYVVSFTDRGINYGSTCSSYFGLNGESYSMKWLNHSKLDSTCWNQIIVSNDSLDRFGR